MVYIKDIKPGAILINGTVKILILKKAKQQYSQILKVKVTRLAVYEFFYNRVTDYTLIINKDKKTILGDWEILC